jgi:hypothetical protein
MAIVRFKQCLDEQFKIYGVITMTACVTLVVYPLLSIPINPLIKTISSEFCMWFSLAFVFGGALLKWTLPEFTAEKTGWDKFFEWNNGD